MQTTESPALKWLNCDVASLTPYSPGRPIETVARELNLDPASIIKLASNENPLGVSRKAKRAIKETASEMHLYPDGGAHNLRRKLARKHDLPPEQFVIGSGSNEIIEFIGHCFMGSDRSIVTSAHAFAIYKIIARMFGSETRETPTTKGLGHDLRAMTDMIDETTSVVFVCNPNNPTGTLIRQPEIRRFLHNVPDDVLVVFDEAYAELCLSRMPRTLELIRDKNNCIILRSFSKAYGLAGLRVGYGMGPKPLIDALQQPRQPFNVNRMAQAAATAALDDQAFLRRSRHLCRESKTYLENRFSELGIDYVPAFTNFILVNVEDGEEVSNRLLERGVIVRPMGGYGLDEYIRVSFGTMEQNQRFAHELEAVMKNA